MRYVRNVGIGLFALFLPLATVLAQANACPELTGLQKAAGLVTGMNILRVFAIVIGLACIAVLLTKWFKWLIAFFLLIPKEFYEALAYIASIGLVFFGTKVSPTNQLWFTLTGSLGLGLSLLATKSIHEIKMRNDVYWGILFVAWSAIAMYFQSSPIGFISMGALMTMLGFSIAVSPLVYVIGFEDDDAVSRGTSAGFLILTIFVLIRILDVNTSFRVFESGALWFGSFVGYLGLLIASSKWYDNKRSYPLMQVITIVMGVAAIWVGSIAGISQLLGVGGTFFVLYLIEKPFDLPAESLTEYAVIGLFVSVALGLGVWWGQNHMELIQPYLLF